MAETKVEMRAAHWAEQMGIYWAAYLVYQKADETVEHWAETMADVMADWKALLKAVQWVVK